MIRNRLLTASIALIALSFTTINCGTGSYHYGMDPATREFILKALDRVEKIIFTGFDRIDLISNSLNKTINSVNMPKLLFGGACAVSLYYGGKSTYTAASEYAKADTAEKRNQSFKSALSGSLFFLLGLGGTGGLWYLNSHQPKLTN